MGGGPAGRQRAEEESRPSAVVAPSRRLEQSINRWLRTVREFVRDSHSTSTETRLNAIANLRIEHESWMNIQGTRSFEIGRAQILPEALRLLEDPEPAVREAAISGLLRYIPKDRQLNVLSRCLNDSDPTVRREAIYQLMELQMPHKRVFADFRGVVMYQAPWNRTITPMIIIITPPPTFSFFLYFEVGLNPITHKIIPKIISIIETIVKSILILVEFNDYLFNYT